MRQVRARDVNAFLREIAGVKISLKDFRTLIASASILEMLARVEPASSERQRRKQVLQAMRAAADDLHNTPAICRRSYVHDTVVAAFEDGVLERFSERWPAAARRPRRAQVLARDRGAGGGADLALHAAHLADLLPLGRGHRLHRQPRVFHQRHVLERASALTAASVTGVFSGYCAITSVAATKTLLLVGRIGIVLLDHLADADDLLLLAGVIEEDAVALLHRP